MAFTASKFKPGNQHLLHYAMRVRALSDAPTIPGPLSICIFTSACARGIEIQPMSRSHASRVPKMRGEQLLVQPVARLRASRSIARCQSGSGVRCQTPQYPPLGAFFKSRRAGVSAPWHDRAAAPNIASSLLLGPVPRRRKPRIPDHRWRRP